MMKVLFIGLIFTSVLAHAECDIKSKVSFTEARVFAPLKGSNATGGFVNIKNNCAEEVELVLKSAQNFKAVETHVTIEEGGVMKMKKIDSFKIKAGETFELAPGGKHLMLFDPQTTIKEGSELKFTFSLNSKEVSVPFKVISRMEKEKHAHH